MMTSHTTNVLLYSSVAGTCKNDRVRFPLVVIFGSFSFVKSDPLTSHASVPEVTLQLKVAVDPSVVFTDVGMLTKAGIQTTHQHQSTMLKTLMSVTVYTSRTLCDQARASTACRATLSSVLSVNNPIVAMSV